MSALLRPEQLHYNPSAYVGHCTPTEAHQKQITQLSTSACGVTAVVNSLVLLNAIDKDNVSKLDHSVCILRTRANDAPLPQYLKSRYNAGCTGEELVESMRRMLTQNKSKLSGLHGSSIESEFISFKDLLEEQQMKRQLYPTSASTTHNPTYQQSSNSPSKRFSSKKSQVSEVPTDSDSDKADVSSFSKLQQQRLLSDYLTSRFQDHWIAVATMNLQVNGNDAWHHQVVYGIDREKDLLYMLNPYETCTLSEVIDYMSTESVLLIKQEDILSRVNRPNADCSIYETELWQPYHVGEQIEEMVSSSASGTNDGAFPFVIIPAAYVPGFAFFRVNGSGHKK